MSDTETKAYTHWLYQAVGIGGRSLFRRLLAESTPAEIYDRARHDALTEMMSGKYAKKAGQIEAAAHGHDIKAEYEKLTARGISFVCYTEPQFPRRLADIPDPPGAIYYVGRLPDDDEKALAVIGARECSEYGSSMAARFGGMLAEAGVQIISGMARGIDGIAQQAALAAGGYSLAVLGCGVDICYPSENRPLYENLIASGGILSEYPPGVEPRALLFPQRNRIISGLSDGVLVVEAKERSGTLITVDMALEQGREVYAVPGRVTDPLSRGCNRLIRQGAELTACPEELLQQMKPGCSVRVREGRKRMTLQGTPGRLYELLDFQPTAAWFLQQKYEEVWGVPITIPELDREMLQLCADGFAERISGSYYVRRG